jgi:hypothetical protein
MRSHQTIAHLNASFKQWVGDIADAGGASYTFHIEATRAYPPPFKQSMTSVPFNKCIQVMKKTPYP